MSYSFSIKASSKEDAIDQVVVQFDSIVLSQPNHAIDRPAVIASVSALISLLAEPHVDDEIVVTVNGSIGWNQSVPEDLLHAHVSIQTNIRNKIKS